MSNSNTRPPYRGTEKGLVISIDFGTTFSGTSWALLDPNQVSQIRDVSGFEGQEDEANSTKVPTVLLYDQSGQLRAAGAKTSDPEIEMQAQEEDWIRVEWFKLLLRPRNVHPELNKAPKAKLPPNKTIVEVVADYLGHMAELARKHFMENMIGSAEIWKEVGSRIEYVLSHPNGWTMTQHARLREAAILGRLVDDSDEGRARIHFVSEGEASFHWCLDEGLSRNDLKKGSKFIIVDAGGGTIDVSSFEVVSTGPLQLKEAAASTSRLAGSVFVNEAFENFVQDNLASRGSTYGDPESIKRMVQDFDKRSKRKFRDVDQKTVVSFGSPREHDPKFGIMSGRLIVKGSDMVKFLEPSCSAAVEAIRPHIAPRIKMNVMLVGGFAANPWLFAELCKRLAKPNVSIFRANDTTAKAAAHGAVGFYLDHFVSARVARWTYGVPCAHPYNPHNRKHIARVDDVYEDDLDGIKYISNGIAVHLIKGAVVKEKEETRISFVRTVRQRRTQILDLQLLCYQGQKTDIEFMDEDDDDLFHQISCVIRAKVPEGCLTRRTRKGGAQYWACTFDVVVSFGTTEFKCFIEWENENGDTVRGPATPVWNEG